MKLHCTLKSFAVAATMSIALSAAPSHALTINFLNGSDLYATMTTTPQTSFDLHFVGQGVAAGGFVSALWMNGPNGTFADSSTDTTASGVYLLDGFNGGGGDGKIYDWQISFPTANNSPDRLTIGEHAYWSIVTPDPYAWNIDKIHINAFDAYGNSIKLNGCVDGATGCTAQVPEPSSLLLLGAGLAGLGIWRKKIA